MVSNTISNTLSSNWSGILPHNVVSEILFSDMVTVTGMLLILIGQQ